MITRRTFLCGITLGTMSAPLAAEAQQSAKTPRIGVLSGVPEGSPRNEALRQGLREFGYVEGQSIAIEWRSAHGRNELFHDLVAEMVRLKVDVIVAGNDAAVEAARKKTKTIPIVMVQGRDPVGSGFVASLARPGGNITGLSGQTIELAGKRVQLLKEAIPDLSRVAILWDPTEPAHSLLVKEAKDAAQALGVQVRLVEARSAGALDSALAALPRQRPAAVLNIGGAMLFAHRARIVEHIVKSRLPMMCTALEWAEAGALMAYSTSFPDLHRRAASFVNKILKGAKPADLPVEQPTKFDLVINLKTAKTLGLTIPQSLLVRADEIIQ